MLFCPFVRSDFLYEGNKEVFLLFKLLLILLFLFFFLKVDLFSIDEFISKFLFFISVSYVGLFFDDSFFLFFFFFSYM